MQEILLRDLKVTQQRLRACLMSGLGRNRTKRELMRVRYFLEELQLLRHVFQDGKHLAVSGH